MPAVPAASFSNRIPSAFARAREVLATLARHLVTIEQDADAAPIENPWQFYWGAAYGPELKQWLLKPVFEALEKEGTIGDLIVDAGSGAAPVTKFLPARAGRKRILVDIAGDNSRQADELGIRLDAEKVGESGCYSFRKAMLRVCKFLEADPGAGANPGRADTMVFSDLLNYVDYRKVIRRFAGFLKPEGRIIIVNLPIRGNQ